MFKTCVAVVAGLAALGLVLWVLISPDVEGIPTRVRPYGESAFLVFPKYRSNTYSLARQEGDRLVPYPNRQAHEKGLITNAVDIHLDSRGTLWVLDSGVVRTLGRPVKKAGPRVLALDADSGQIKQTVPLDGLVRGRAQFLEVEETTEGPERLYISDGPARCIVVWEVASGRGKRLLLPRAVSHPSEVLYMALVSPTSLYFTYYKSPDMYVVDTKEVAGGRGLVKRVGSKPPGVVLIGREGRHILFRVSGSPGRVYSWDTGSGLSRKTFVQRDDTGTADPLHAVADIGKTWVLEADLSAFLSGKKVSHRIRTIHRPNNTSNVPHHRGIRPTDVFVTTTTTTTTTTRTTLPPKTTTDFDPIEPIPNNELSTTTPMMPSLEPETSVTSSLDNLPTTGPQGEPTTTIRPLTTASSDVESIDDIPDTSKATTPRKPNIAYDTTVPPVEPNTVQPLTSSGAEPVDDQPDSTKTTTTPNIASISQLEPISETNRVVQFDNYEGTTTPAPILTTTPRPEITTLTPDDDDNSGATTSTIRPETTTFTPETSTVEPDETESTTQSPTLTTTQQPASTTPTTAIGDNEIPDATPLVSPIEISRPTPKPQQTPETITTVQPETTTNQPEITTTTQPEIKPSSLANTTDVSNLLTPFPNTSSDDVTTVKPPTEDSIEATTVPQKFLTPPPDVKVITDPDVHLKPAPPF